MNLTTEKEQSDEIRNNLVAFSLFKVNVAMDSCCTIQVFTQIFVYSRGGYKSLLQYKIPESNTIDFQVEALYLTSNGIPNKLGKLALIFGENRVVS